jgi:hypothetical protein
MSVKVVKLTLYYLAKELERVQQYNEPTHSLLIDPLSLHSAFADHTWLVS